MFGYEQELLQFAATLLAIGLIVGLAILSGRKVLSAATGFDYFSPFWVVCFLIFGGLTLGIMWVAFEYMGQVGVLILIWVIIRMVSSNK